MHSFRTVFIVRNRKHMVQLTLDNLKLKGLEKKVQIAERLIESIYEYMYFHNMHLCKCIHLYYKIKHMYIHNYGHTIYEKHTNEIVIGYFKNI